MDATRDMKKEYKRIALETKGRYHLVGMDPKRFLEECLNLQELHQQNGNKIRAFRWFSSVFRFPKRNRETQKPNHDLV